MDARPLTPKQQRFVEEYLATLNATAAYRAAYPRCGSDNAAGVEGHKLLSNPKIVAALDAARRARSERVRLTQDDVLRRLVVLADHAGEGSSHAARVRATELLGKHLGMFPDRVRLGGDDEAPPVRLTHDLDRDAFDALPPGERVRILRAQVWLPEGN